MLVSASYCKFLLGRKQAHERAQDLPVDGRTLSVEALRHVLGRLSLRMDYALAPPQYRIKYSINVPCLRLAVDQQSFGRLNEGSARIWSMLCLNPHSPHLARCRECGLECVGCSIGAFFRL
jgi:hypothetical protein